MNVWLRLSATFHEHPKMLSVRKDAKRAADSAELGWYRVLMASKRYGRWTFASEEHLEHVADSFYRYVPLYRKHRLLDGLTIHDGESYNAVKTPAERKEEQREREVSREGVTSQRDMPRDQNVTLEEREKREKNTEREETHAPDAAVSLYQRTGRYPTPKVTSWLDDLCREAGAGDTSAGEKRLADLIDATPMGGSANVKDYLTLITDALRRSARDATRAELADEAERVAAKRQPVRLVPAPDDTTPEEAERLAAAWDAEYGRKPA